MNQIKNTALTNQTFFVKKHLMKKPFDHNTIFFKININQRKSRFKELVRSTSEDSQPIILPQDLTSTAGKPDNQPQLQQTVVLPSKEGGTSGTAVNSGITVNNTNKSEPGFKNIYKPSENNTLGVRGSLVGYNGQFSAVPFSSKLELETSTKCICFSEIINVNYYDNDLNSVNNFTSKLSTSIKLNHKLQLFTKNKIDSNSSTLGLTIGEEVKTTQRRGIFTTKQSELSKLFEDIQKEKEIKRSILPIIKNSSLNIMDVLTSQIDSTNDLSGIIQRCGFTLISHLMSSNVNNTNLRHIGDNQRKSINVVALSSDKEELQRQLNSSSSSDTTLFSIESGHEGVVLTAMMASYTIPPVLYTHDDLIPIGLNYNPLELSGEVSIYTNNPIAVNNLIIKYSNNPFLSLENVYKVLDFISDSVGYQNLTDALNEFITTYFINLSIKGESIFYDKIAFPKYTGLFEFKSEQQKKKIVYSSEYNKNLIAENLSKSIAFSSLLMYQLQDDVNNHCSHSFISNLTYMKNTLDTTKDSYNVILANGSFLDSLYSYLDTKPIFSYFSKVTKSVKQFVQNTKMVINQGENIPYIKNDKMESITLSPLINIKNQSYIKGTLAEILRAQQPYNLRIEGNKVISMNRYSYEIALLFSNLNNYEYQKQIVLNKLPIVGIINENTKCLMNKAINNFGLSSGYFNFVYNTTIYDIVNENPAEVEVEVVEYDDLPFNNADLGIGEPEVSQNNIDIIDNEEVRPLEDYQSFEENHLGKNEDERQMDLNLETKVDFIERREKEYNISNVCTIIDQIVKEEQYKDMNLLKYENLAIKYERIISYYEIKALFDFSYNYFDTIMCVYLLSEMKQWVILYHMYVDKFEPRDLNEIDLTLLLYNDNKPILYLNKYTKIFDFKFVKTIFSKIENYLNKSEYQISTEDKILLYNNIPTVEYLYDAFGYPKQFHFDFVFKTKINCCGISMIIINNKNLHIEKYETLVIIKLIKSFSNNGKLIPLPIWNDNYQNNEWVNRLWTTKGVKDLSNDGTELLNLYTQIVNINKALKHKGIVLLQEEIYNFMNNPSVDNYLSTLNIQRVIGVLTYADDYYETDDDINV